MKKHATMNEMVKAHPMKRHSTQTSMAIEAKLEPVDKATKVIKADLLNSMATADFVASTATRKTNAARNKAITKTTIKEISNMASPEKEDTIKATMVTIKATVATIKATTATTKATMVKIIKQIILSKTHKATTHST